MDYFVVRWDGEEVGVYDVYLNGNKQLLFFDRAVHERYRSPDADGVIEMDERTYTPQGFKRRMLAAGAGENSYESPVGFLQYMEGRKAHHDADLEGRVTQLFRTDVEVVKSHIFEVLGPVGEGLYIGAQVVRGFLHKIKEELS